MAGEYDDGWKKACLGYRLLDKEVIFYLAQNVSRCFRFFFSSF